MKSRNEQTIKNAFERLATNKHNIIVNGMKPLLDNAVKFALKRHHAEGLPGHLETGDSYGWALAYNGEMIAMEVTKGYDEILGGVSEELEYLALKDNVGYIGIVMAGLNPPSYYKVEYEDDIIEDTLHFTAHDFDRYFKKI